MSIEDFGEAAKAKINLLEQQIIGYNNNIVMFTAEIAKEQQMLTDAASSLETHKSALAALEGIAPELKTVLNGLVSATQVEGA